MITLKVNQKKVIKTKALLLDIIRQPLKYKDNEPLKSTLKSQGGLAKFTDSEQKIKACSLNTLKSASESLLGRGFIELDELRVSAKNAIEGVIDDSKATKSTRTGLRHKVDGLESQLNIMKKSNFLLTTMITELRGQLKNMAYSDNTTEQRQSRYNELNRKIEAKLNYTLNGEV